MAAKLEAGAYSRSELFLIDPDEINVDDSLNGRWQPHTEDDITALAETIKTEGQLQPVQVRKLADNTVQLVLGYRRHAAVQKLNKGKKAEDRLKLKCVLTTANDEEAFRRNIVENKNRKSTSPVDDANNQRRLREQYGWTDVKIAEFYNCSPSMVNVLKKVLLLPEDTKAKVHRRELALNTAVALVELTPEEQVEVLKPEETPPEEVPAEPGTAGGTEGTKPKGKGKGGKGGKGKGGKGKGKGNTPSTKTVLKRVRTIKAKKVASGGAAGKSTSRSLSEVRNFLGSMTGPGERKAVRETAEFLLKFIGGTYTDDSAAKKFVEILT